MENAQNHISVYHERSSFRMFNSSYDSSPTNLLSSSASIEYFDDEDLSDVHFWMLIGSSIEMLHSPAIIFISGAFISFFALLFAVVAIIVFYELCAAKTRNDLQVAQSERLKEFQVSAHPPD